MLPLFCTENKSVNDVDLSNVNA